MDRPAVDVVVPFAGPDAALERLLETLSRVALDDRDTMVVVDNGPPGRAPRSFGDRRRVIVDVQRRSSYHARQRGAAEGAAEWLLFVDADTAPPARLLDAYFAEPVDDGVAVLAGAVIDEPAGAGAGAAARYARLRASMSQQNTAGGVRPYAQTANCAVRRAAFEQIGGFETGVRSGGDADLCFRLEQAGWALRERPSAAVVHAARPTLRAMLRQLARHGSGAAWLERRYPGTFPPRLGPGLALWALRRAAVAAAALARGDRDAALVSAVEPLAVWAFELGRLFPNEVARRG